MSNPNKPVLVRNPTSSAKAIRIPGGHKVLKGGEEEELVLGHLSKSEIDGLKAAGLAFGKAPEVGADDNKPKK